MKIKKAKYKIGQKVISADGTIFIISQTKLDQVGYSYSNSKSFQYFYREDKLFANFTEFKIYKTHELNSDLITLEHDFKKFK